MRRILVVLLALGLLLAGTAQAQVAAPDLNPAAYHTETFQGAGLAGGNITPDNPAALSWAMFSSVSAASIDYSDDLGGSASGWLAGFRIVGKSVAVAVEGFSVDDATNTGSGKGVQFSYRLFESLAVGIGLENSVQDPAIGSVDSKSLGLSMQFGKTFYVGVALGTEDGSNGYVGSRDVTEYGIAWQPMGAWRWHLAFDRVDKPDFSGSPNSGFLRDTFTLQTVIGSVLVGYAQMSTSIPGLIDATSKALDLGWVPEKGGFSVTARVEDTELQLFPNNRKTTIALSYLF